MNRRLILATMGTFAALGGPWICYTGADYWSKARKTLFAAPSAAAPDTAAEPSVESANTAAAPVDPAVMNTYYGAPVVFDAAPPSGPRVDPVVRLDEALRFDISPPWIMQRWPRVSAAVPELQLQGYRVPLVSGTLPSDVAGSLTYYFNPQQQLQRIAFQGTTGDIGPLAQLLVGRFRLTRRLTNDPGMIVFEGVTPTGKPASVVRMRSMPMVRADDPLRRYRVELVLERPTT